MVLMMPCLLAKKPHGEDEDNQEGQGSNTEAIVDTMILKDGGLAVGVLNLAGLGLTNLT